MDYIWIIGIIVLFIVISWFKGGQTQPLAMKKYRYKIRTSLATQNETYAYRRIMSLVDTAKYGIAPQAHLSAFLDERIRGQNWKGARASIDRKSVDFLIYELASLRPVLAIEIDDKTHDRPNRIQRDKAVESCMQSAGMRLVRLRNVYKMTDEKVRQTLNL